MTDIQLEPQYREAFDTWKRLPSPQSSGQLLKTVKPVINTALRCWHVFTGIYDTGTNYG